MAQTDAQRRAALKYRKERTKTVSVCFYPADMELYEHVQKQPKKAAYIKRLIAEDL